MIVARLVISVAVIAGGTACGLPQPSRAFACEISADCAPGRTCDDRGYCVVTSSIPDATSDEDPGGGADAGADAAMDCTTWTTPRHFAACDLPAPAAGLTLTSGTYVLDTDTGTLTGPGTDLTLPSVVVASGLAVSIESLAIEPAATLRVTGNRPLIVAAWSTIDIAGLIDASSNVGGRGAGRDPPTCTAHSAGAGDDSVNGAGGGGGGGFRGPGGPGGSGDVPGGTAGGAVGSPLLLGGCPGGFGGAGDRPGGPGGSGGGAVQITARSAIAITGRLHAGGAGGAGGIDPDGVDADGGGGGGGSGGMLGLTAPSVIVSAGAILAANGGGGGQGADIEAGARGADASIGAARADGGSSGGDVDGDDGGRGSGGAALAGAPGGEVGDNGGGGGGGGAGYIVIDTSAPQIDGGAVVSPAFSLP